MLAVFSKLRTFSRGNSSRPARRFLLIGSFVIAACICLPSVRSGAQTTERVVDLELVVAADISGSMDLKEAALQRRGFAQAIRHPDVVRVIRQGHLGRIAISYVEWAGDHYQRMMVGWREVSDAKSANAFAEELGRLRFRTERWTSISGAIDFAARSFQKNGFRGRRRVIDISGDGPNNMGPSVVHARNRAVKNGIVINGLPIINDRPDHDGSPRLPNLDLYYTDCVIGGRGAFVIVAHGIRDFARAVRRKMVLEIAGNVPKVFPLRLTSARFRPPCNAGELLLLDWLISPS